MLDFLGGIASLLVQIDIVAGIGRGMRRAWLALFPSRRKVAQQKARRTHRKDVRYAKYERLEQKPAPRWWQRYRDFRSGS